MERLAKIDHFHSCKVLVIYGPENLVRNMTRKLRSHVRLDGVEIVIWLLYADDLVLFCKIIAEVKTIMNILNDACSRFRLTIAFPKTKIHCFQSEKMWWTMYQSSHTLAKRSAIKIKAVLQTFVYQKHLGISMKRGRCLRTRK